MFIDWFSVRYDLAQTGDIKFEVTRKPAPFPNDGHLAEALEYVSALTALELSSGPEFHICELGAGWGPWTATGVQLARNAGKQHISAIAVEAATSKIKSLRDHLTLNGISVSRGGEGNQPFCKIINAAAWHETTELFFPKDVDDSDFGASISTTLDAIDYRGLRVEPLK